MEGAALLELAGTQVEIQAVGVGCPRPCRTRTDAIPLIVNDLPDYQKKMLRQAEVAFGRPPLWYPAIYNRTSEAMMSVVQLLSAEDGA